MTRADLRAQWAAAVLPALAERFSLTWGEHGCVTALARALGIQPQQLDKAARGLRSSEWLAVLAREQGIVVVQDEGVDAYPAGYPTSGSTTQPTNS